MENVLHVFIFFQFFNELVDAFTLFRSDFFQIVRDTDKFTFCNFVTLVFQIFLDSRVLGEFPIDNDFIIFSINFIYTKVNQFQFQFIQVDIVFFSDMENAFMLEHEFKASAGAQRTAVFVEITADIGYRTCRIISSRFHEDGNTIRAIAFVVHFFIISEIF